MAASGRPSARGTRIALHAATASAATPIPSKTPKARSIERRGKGYSCFTRSPPGAMMAPMSSTETISSYEEARAQHRWDVPERYNIAADICDRHPREKLAMVHEHHDGTVREVTWGELQDTSNRFANVLTAHGVTAGDRVAMLLPATPETASAFFGTWK